MRNKKFSVMEVAAMAMMGSFGGFPEQHEITLPRDPDPNLDSANKKIEAARLARQEKYKNKRLTN